MKKIGILILFAGMTFFANAQTCDRSKAASCDKTWCCPEGPNMEEAAVIKAMRSEVQHILIKMSKSESFTKQIEGLQIPEGKTDDESLLYIFQAVNVIRFELMKIESAAVVPLLVAYQPTSFSNEQQMVTYLKAEIKKLSEKIDDKC